MKGKPEKPKNKSKEQRFDGKKGVAFEIKRINTWPNDNNNNKKIMVMCGILFSHVEILSSHENTHALPFT